MIVSCFTTAPLTLSKRRGSIRAVLIYRRKSHVYSHYKRQDCPMRITEIILQYYKIYWAESYISFFKVRSVPNNVCTHSHFTSDFLRDNNRTCYLGLYNIVIRKEKKTRNGKRKTHNADRTYTGRYKEENGRTQLLKDSARIRS